jgi:hypothetical protein
MMNPVISTFSTVAHAGNLVISETMAESSTATSALIGGGGLRSESCTCHEGEKIKQLRALLTHIHWIHHASCARLAFVAPAVILPTLTLSFAHSLIDLQWV